MPDPTEQRIAEGVEQEEPTQESGAASSATLVHELLQPLNHILGYSELLLEQAKGGQLEPFNADLEKIHTAATTLLALINSVVVSPKPGSLSPIPSIARDRSRQRTKGPDRVPVSAGREIAAHSSGHLMVVDDDDVNRDLLSRRLRQQGYQASVAEHGRRALELIQSQPVDLVLLDVLMPEMDGYEMLKQLKADPSLRDIPVIMISALDEIQSVVRCIEYGAEDYLPKPFNPVLLRARISACLEKKRLRDQEVLYLRHVSHVTAAAAAVEAGQLGVDLLSEVSQRPDELGQLARVFQRMAQEVAAREQRFKQEIESLRIEIDETKKARQVAELTETDFFQQLREKARSLRSKK